MWSGDSLASISLSIARASTASASACRSGCRNCRYVTHKVRTATKSARTARTIDNGRFVLTHSRSVVLGCVGVSFNAASTFSIRSVSVGGFAILASSVLSGEHHSPPLGRKYLEWHFVEQSRFL